MATVHEFQLMIDRINENKNIIKGTTIRAELKLLEFQEQDFANINKSLIDNSLNILFRDINYFDTLLSSLFILDNSVKNYIEQIRLAIKSYNDLVLFMNNAKLKLGLQGKLKEDVKKQYPDLFNEENDTNLTDYERTVRDVANLPIEETPLETNTGGKKRKLKKTHKRIRKHK